MRHASSRRKGQHVRVLLRETVSHLESRVVHIAEIPLQVVSSPCGGGHRQCGRRQREGTHTPPESSQQAGDVRRSTLVLVSPLRLRRDLHHAAFGRSTQPQIVVLSPHFPPPPRSVSVVVPKARRTDELGAVDAEVRPLLRRGIEHGQGLVHGSPRGGIRR